MSIQSIPFELYLTSTKSNIQNRVKCVVIQNKKFVTKTVATQLLGYSNKNSIDQLILGKQLQSFKIAGIEKSLIPLDQIQNHPRFNKENANL